MNTKKKILELIKDRIGITVSALCNLLPDQNPEQIKECVRELIDKGMIAQSRSKLYPVLRQILIFDRSTEELVEEINLDNLTADMLKNAFNNKSNDPLFFDVYDLTRENSDFFSKKYKLKFHFDKNHYQLTAGFNRAIAE